MTNWNKLMSDDRQQMRTMAIIEARMGSSRLPGKVMGQILSRPMLELLLERLSCARRLDGIVVATTTAPADVEIEELAHRLGVGCFRGSEEDVLDRVLLAAHEANAEVIVEITGDCPLIDPQVVDKVVRVYQSEEWDYVSNTLRRTFPRGLDTQVFATAVLEQVAQSTQDPVDHEHVSLYIYEHPEQFSLANVESGLSEKYWDTRLTVDTAEDFALITAIFEELYPKNASFNLQDVVDFLERRPEILALNSAVQQKAIR